MHVRSGMRLPVVGFIVVILLGLAGRSAAEEWPNLKPGMWEFTRTIHSSRAPGKPSVVRSKRCLDPVADLKQQNARLSRAGCRFTPMTRRGNLYSMSSQCSMMGMNVKSKTTITVTHPGAYTLHVDTVEDGQTGKEDLMARRVGDCPARP